MSDTHEEDRQQDQTAVNGRSLSRREFLKYAGLAGATVGLGAGLGGLAAACGGETTTTTGAQTTTTGAQTTTTGAATTVSTSAEAGPEVKLGFVSPITGGLASFGIPDNWCADKWREYIGDGVVLGDGKKHPISITVSDSQSDSNRAAQVAGDLINNTQVDLMMVASTPDTVTPVVEQCEAAGVPVVSTDCPWQTYLGKNTEYKWSYHMFFGAEDFFPVMVSMFDKVQTNKKAAGLFDNSADGLFFAEFDPLALTAAGYEVTVGSLFQPMTEDFTSIISQFKQAGCELLVGNCIPPDWTNFWKQAIQQGLGAQMKIVLATKATLFPQSIEALGDVGNGLVKELWWHPTYPWKSSLTGETCQQLADDFTAKTDLEPTAPILHYVVGEMALYALTKATDPKSKDAVLAAIETMNFEAITGPIDFTAPLVARTNDTIVGYPGGPGHKTKNVYSMGLGGSQWLAQGGRWQFDEVPVDKASAPYILDSTLQPIKPLPITS
jgi:branched-chain amino acid transport system substrate-binding protein